MSKPDKWFLFTANADDALYLDKFLWRNQNGFEKIWSRHEILLSELFQL